MDRQHDCAHQPDAPAVPSLRARAAAFMLAMLIAWPLAAEPIQQRLASGLLANADYHRGEANQPAILVLHGLLATHNFPTVQHIAMEMQDAGYSVLTPTLTMGVGDRKASLPCTALQLHTMEQTVAELGWWADWLVQRGHRQIYLVGHSAGSVQILAYSLGKPNPAVRGQILTSLVALEGLPDKAPEGESAERARERIAAGDHGIAKYDVSFCHGSFTAPPEVFLSYHHWDKQQVIRALQQTPLPHQVIMGGNDNRFTGTSWMPMLREATGHLSVIDGASHFFDGSAEFALLDKVHGALRAMQAAE